MQLDGQPKFSEFGQLSGFKFQTSSECSVNGSLRRYKKAGEMPAVLKPERLAR